MDATKAGLQTPVIGRRDFLKLGAGAGAAAMTTGLITRKLSAQGKAPGPPVSIDLHTHWAPDAYNKALSKLRHGPGLNSDPRSSDLDARVKWMDTHGVKMHVLTLSGRMPWQWVPPDVGAHLAQIWNDAATAAHSKYPDRFMAGIAVSIRSPQLALAELNRMAGKPGMRAVSLPNSIEGRDYLVEERYAEFLARVAELDLPILFHPLDGDENIYGGWQSRMATPVAKAANLHNTLGFPFEHATTAAKLIITHTMDKHPNLQVVLPHSGGIFPYIAGRVHRGFVNHGFDAKMSFKDYLRRFHYDSLTYYPQTLRFLVNLVGADRVVIGTDNFATMDVEYPNALVEQINLPDADREKILRGNASRLLKL